MMQNENTCTHWNDTLIQCMYMFFIALWGIFRQNRLNGWDFHVMVVSGFMTAESQSPKAKFSWLNTIKNPAGSHTWFKCTTVLNTISPVILWKI